MWEDPIFNTESCDICSNHVRKINKSIVCKACERKGCDECFKYYKMFKNYDIEEISICIECFGNFKTFNNSYFINDILYNTSLNKKNCKILKILLLISNNKNKIIKKYIPKTIFKQCIIPYVLSIMNNQILELDKSKHKKPFWLDRE